MDKYIIMAKDNKKQNVFLMIDSWSTGYPYFAKDIEKAKIFYSIKEAKKYWSDCKAFCKRYPVDSISIIELFYKEIEKL